MGVDKALGNIEPEVQTTAVTQRCLLERLAGAVIARRRASAARAASKCSMTSTQLGASAR